MEPLLHAASNLSALAAGSLISAIWQGTVLACAVALCLRRMPRLSAASRSLVWLNVFFLLVLLHVLPAFRGPGAGFSSGPVAHLDLDLRWSLAIVTLWAVLSLWRAGQLMLSAVNVRQLAHRAKPMSASPELQALLTGGRRKVELCSSDEVSRPSVFGFFRPRILLPPGLVEKLTGLELKQVVLHELEHLRRADDWTNLLQKLALVFFPLNPALLWVERKLCAERELACDDRVLAEGGAGKAYAVCLTRLAEFSMIRRSVSLVLGAWERRPELVKRVHRLLRRPHAAMGSVQAKFVTVGLMSAVIVVGFELARSPQLVGFVQKAPAVHAVSVGMAGAFAQPAVFHGGNVRAVNGHDGFGEPHVVQATAVVSSEPAQRVSKPVKKHALQHKMDPRQQPDSAWMVLTEWTDATLPPHPVMAVKFDPRGSYAAFPVRGGWIIVQI